MTVSQVLDSSYSMEGDEFFAEVTDDVYGDEGIIIPKGTYAHGKLTNTTAPGRMGKEATMDLSFDYLVTPDGREIPIEGHMSTKLHPIKAATKIIATDVGYTAVGGLEAGGWTNTVTGCEVSGSLTLNATNKVSHGGEIYFGGMLGENYSTMTTCKTDVELSLNYKDEGTESTDSEMVINVGGLSGSGTSITGSTVKMSATVSAVKASGASSVNVGGIIGSQRYMTTSGNTVEGAITTTGCSLDETEGALNVGGVGGRIDVYYMLQILAYTPIASSGAENNVQNVTVNGAVTDKIIADAISAISGCWYVAKGDQPAYGATSNIDAVVAEYGSYLPVDSLQNGIIFIANTPPQAQ